MTPGQAFLIWFCWMAVGGAGRGGAGAAAGLPGEQDRRVGVQSCEVGIDGGCVGGFDKDQKQRQCRHEEHEEQGRTGGNVAVHQICLPYLTEPMANLPRCRFASHGSRLSKGGGAGKKNSVNHGFKGEDRACFGEKFMGGFILSPAGGQMAGYKMLRRVGDGFAWLVVRAGQVWRRVAGGVVGGPDLPM